MPPQPMKGVAMTIQSLPKSDRISQFTLARFVKLSNQIANLKAEQSALEQQLTYALESGAEVESGNHAAKLRTTERRSVQWKAVVIRLKSEGYARRVLASTKPKTYVKLIVR